MPLRADSALPQFDALPLPPLTRRHTPATLRCRFTLDYH